MKFNYSEPQDHRIFYVEFKDFKGLVSENKVEYQIITAVATS